MGERGGGGRGGGGGGAGGGGGQFSFFVFFILLGSPGNGKYLDGISPFSSDHAMFLRFSGFLMEKRGKKANFAFFQGKLGKVERGIFFG